LFNNPKPLPQLLSMILRLLWYSSPRPNRNHTNPHQNTHRQNDENPFPPHDLTLSDTAQLRNLFAIHFFAKCVLPPHTLWRAPAARSGDGALARPTAFLHAKAVSHFVCHRTPHFPRPRFTQFTQLTKL